MSRNQGLTVMISSTALDLPQHRREVQEACIRQGMFPNMMEYLPASDADAVKVSLDMVDKSDIYVGIFGSRYGHVTGDRSISITEMEYDRATERGIPRLIFIMDDKHLPIVAEPESPEAAVKQTTLIERLKREHVVNFFTSPLELRALAINALSYHRQLPSRTSYVSDIPQPPEPYIAHPYILLPTDDLIGRQSELDALTDWATDFHSAPVAAVVGMGGIGKSALTWKWFNSVAPDVMESPTGRVWWSFYESNANFMDFITRTLLYVDGLYSFRLRHNLNEIEDEGGKILFARRESHTDYDVSDYVYRLLYLLDQQPFLVVLDGLERLLEGYGPNDPHSPGNEEERQEQVDYLVERVGIKDTQHFRKATDPQVVMFLRRLTRLKTSRVLISTRVFPADLQLDSGEPVPGSTAIYLKGLTDKDAIELWRSLGVRGSTDILLQTFHAFENYPLLIRALAGEVARYRYAPGDFDAWRQANPAFNPFNLSISQVRSHVLDFALQGLAHAASDTLSHMAAFRLSVSYETLVGLLLGPHKPLRSEVELDAILDELENRGLIGWDRRANFYSLHPVVRGIILHRLDEMDRQQIYEILYAYLQLVPMESNWRLIRQTEELTSAIEYYNTLINLGRYDDAFDVYRTRIEYALLYRLGGHQQRAELLRMLFPDGTDRLPRLQNSNAQSFTLNGLALAYHLSGCPGIAADLHRRQIMLDECVIGTSEYSEPLKPYSYPITLSNRDGVLETVQRKEYGLRGGTTTVYYILREDIIRETKSSRNTSQENLSVGYCNLSQSLLMLGKIYAAEQSAIQALYYTRQTTDRELEPFSLWHLALTLAIRGNVEDARMALQRFEWIETILKHIADSVQTQATKSYAIERRSRAILLSKIALAQMELWGLPATGISHGWEAVEWLKQFRLEDRYPEENVLVIDIVRAERIVGSAALRQGDFDRAEKHLKQALTQARIINYMSEELQALLAMAELARLQRKLGYASALLDEIWEPIRRGPYRLLLADAYNVLAAIQHNRGNVKDGIEAARQAYELAWCDGLPFVYWYGLEQARHQIEMMGGLIPQLAPFDATRYPQSQNLVIDFPDEFSQIPKTVANTLQQSQSDETRLRAVYALGAVGSGAHHYLVKSLKHRDSSVCLNAALLLSEQGRSEGVSILLKRIRSVPPDQSERFLRAFGTAKDSRAVPVLRRFLRNGPHRLTALKSLYMLQGDASAPLLITLLKDDDDEVQYEATQKLAEIGHNEGLEHIVQTLRLHASSCRLSDRFISFALQIAQKYKIAVPVESINVLLQHQPLWSQIAQNCLAALAVTKDQAAVPALVEALKGHDPNFRVQIVKTLTAIGGVQVQEALQDIAVNDPSSAVRQFAILQRSSNPVQRANTGTNMTAEKLARLEAIRAANAVKKAAQGAKKEDLHDNNQESSQ